MSLMWRITYTVAALLLVFGALAEYFGLTSKHAANGIGLAGMILLFALVLLPVWKKGGY